MFVSERNTLFSGALFFCRIKLKHQKGRQSQFDQLSTICSYFILPYFCGLILNLREIPNVNHSNYT